MKSPCYLVTLSLESSDFQTFLKQYVILVPFGALIFSWSFFFYKKKFYKKNYCAYEALQLVELLLTVNICEWNVDIHSHRENILLKICDFGTF